MTIKIISLSLTEETNQILDDLSAKTKLKKSEFIRKILYFFNRNPSELKNMLIAEIGDMDIE